MSETAFANGHDMRVRHEREERQKAGKVLVSIADLEMLGRGSNTCVEPWTGRVCGYCQCAQGNSK